MPQDPGIGTGVGGLFASLFNPGLATRVAQHITPNPNPLAQQGGPAAPGSVDSLGNPSPSGPPPGSNLAPAAVTQPDPVNASYAADLMRYDRMNKLSDDLNRNIQGVAAGFGTAQQQASKHRGPRPRRRRGRFARRPRQTSKGCRTRRSPTTSMPASWRTLRSLRSDLVAVAWPARVRPRSHDHYEQPGPDEGVRGRGGAGTRPDRHGKDAEAATRAWAAAHPEATPKDIADYKANLIAGGMGGSDLEQRQYLAERSAALAAGQKDSRLSDLEGQACRGCGGEEEDGGGRGGIQGHREAGLHVRQFQTDEDARVR